MILDKIFYEKVRVDSLVGSELNWAVKKAHKEHPPRWSPFIPASNWAQGGQIIEREMISLEFAEDRWHAEMIAPNRPEGYAYADGPTPLLAAMRCFCVAKLGSTVKLQYRQGD